MCYIDNQDNNKACEGWQSGKSMLKQVLSALIVLIAALGVVSTAVHIWYVGK